MGSEDVARVWELGDYDLFVPPPRDEIVIVESETHENRRTDIVVKQRPGPAVLDASWIQLDSHAWGVNRIDEQTVHLFPAPSSTQEGEAISRMRFAIKRVLGDSDETLYDRAMNGIHHLKAAVEALREEKV